MTSQRLASNKVNLLIPTGKALRNRRAYDTSAVIRTPPTREREEIKVLVATEEVKSKSREGSFAFAFAVAVIVEVEDLSNIGDDHRAGQFGPFTAALETRPDIQPMNVGAPTTHRLNDRLVGTHGEEGRRTTDPYRVSAELVGVLAYLEHEVADGREHRVIAERRALSDYDPF